MGVGEGSPLTLFLLEIFLFEIFTPFSSSKINKYLFMRLCGCVIRNSRDRSSVVFLSGNLILFSVANGLKRRRISNTNNSPNYRDHKQR